MAPLVVLFELSVLLARIFERRRAAAEDKPDEDDPFDADREWDRVDEDLPVS
jgi:hypothetical protein